MMNNKIFRSVFAVMVLCLVMLFVTGCAKDVTVTVDDCGTTTEVQTKTGKTIGEVLSEAGITLGEKDETEPKVDVELDEETATIVVKRYAKVSVIKDGKTTEVEVMSATVEEVLKKAGITLSDAEGTDVELNAYVQDGMSINIYKEKTVSLTADSQTKSITTKANTVKDLLDEQKITLGDDDELSEKPDAELKDGMKIVVKRVEYKQETRTEKVDYSTREESSSSMASGTSEVKQSGVEGEKEVTYKVKYVDGKEKSKEKISEKITKEPVDQIVVYGTKQNTQSSGKSVVSKTPVYDCDGSGHGYYEIVYSDGTTDYVEF